MNVKHKVSTTVIHFGGTTACYIHFYISETTYDSSTIPKDTNLLKIIQEKQRTLISRLLQFAVISREYYRLEGIFVKKTRYIVPHTNDARGAIQFYPE